MESNNRSLSELPQNNLRNNVVSVLRQKGYAHHRTLAIMIDHGTVTAEGSVPTWYLRQIALECIKRVPGVVGVVDRIRVITESPEDNSPYLAPVVVQPATENAQPKACPTKSLPNQKPAQRCAFRSLKNWYRRCGLGKIASHQSVEDEHKSLHSWMQPQIEMPDEERQLQTVCG